MCFPRLDTAVSCVTLTRMPSEEEVESPGSGLSSLLDDVHNPLHPTVASMTHVTSARTNTHMEMTGGDRVFICPPLEGQGSKERGEDSTARMCSSGVVTLSSREFGASG